MAVVTVKSPAVFGALLSATTGQRAAPDYTTARGVVHRTAGRVDNASADSNGSKYVLATLPSACVLLVEDSIVDLQNWGYAAATIGDPSDTDSLLASVTISGESDVRALGAHADSNWNKPLWEALGMSEDPGGLIELAIHTAAGATGDGYATFDLRWAGN